MPIWKRTVTPERINEVNMPNSMAGALGIEFTAIGDDFLEARMEVGSRTKQPFGFLHGGATCALVETVGSIASTLVVGYGEMECFGIELNANHLKAVRDGWVSARATPLQLGRSLHVWDVRVMDEQKRLICVGRLTVMVRPLKHEAPRA